ncbi:hypothetical protein CLV63_12227 [Murinocardiopsis flavida]|uniref:Toxin-antitoxin system HicB family antitoxin n=1 Tax=Murinocardiopsis flavida TaxID=645275 RepID=A0A2P8CZV2_9ACTN|nr:hypothetical protein [Murinocardiopsis flavida]PSK90493.1 hypothetical protein CLV63_12227 [Murinocardiopsis flavida]
MVVLRIESVPEHVRDALVRAADAKGQSLQALLLDLVEARARRAKNMAAGLRGGLVTGRDAGGLREKRH